MKPWLAAARPKTLVAGIIPVVLGSAHAFHRGQFELGVFVAALFGALAIQVGTNYVNDASDFLRGADTGDRLGPPRMAAMGLLTPRALYRGSALAFLLAFAAGLYLIHVAGWPLLAIGLVSIFFAVGYTAGPFPLAYLGLGDAFVLLFFGLVAVLGTFYAHARMVDTAAVLVALATGFHGVGLIAVNNLRDIPTDVLAGKRTVAVRLGDRGARVYVAALCFLPYLCWAPMSRELPLPYFFFPYLSLPLAFLNARSALRIEDRREFNALLARSAGLQLAFGLLASLAPGVGRVTAYSFAFYRRAFVDQHRYGAHAVGAREGILLRAELEGKVLFAEAAPLPSHSRETIADVRSALPRFVRADLEDLPPSLRWAREALALLTLVEPGHPVRANALLAAHEWPRARARLAELSALGYREVKIKLPAGDWESFAGLLTEFPSLRFRLDANQALGPAGLERLSSLLLRAGALPLIDYLEEPFAGVFASRAFAGGPLALAADESASSLEQARELLAGPNPPSVFILKPTVLGGFAALESFSRELASSGGRAIVTSALETEPGRRALIAALCRSPLAREAAGLCTGHLFAENHLADQPLWRAVPAVAEAEANWLRSLEWRELPS